jgi:hypothetical protein
MMGYFVLPRGSSDMPTNKEFVIRLEDRPGFLAKLCSVLADRGVNILAFQSNPSNGKALVHFVADNPANAKAVLDAERFNYTQKEVAQIKLPHRPGELAQVTSLLGDAKMNINYAYFGMEPRTKAPLLIFGVADASRAVSVLEEISAATGA